MNRVQKKAANLILSYLANNPMERLPAMLDLAEKLDRGNLHGPQIRTMREMLCTKGSVWNGFTERLFEEVEPRCVHKLLECFFINGSLEGSVKASEIAQQYECNVPWAILMDPTSACNLKCTGCWAAQYGGNNNLSYEMLDSVIRQGKEIGIHFYIFSGGEPLVRKRDIIRLCDAHPECYFFAFTNGTLVDEEFCKEIVRVANFTLAFSIEGDEESTDMRRGKGTYKHVIEAMSLMQSFRLPFGYSTCYHSKNTEKVGSDAFIDDMISRGCRFAWNFTYMPIGEGAPVDLLATAEQRIWMHKRIREIRDTKPIFALDFWNDGEYTEGCIAGGRRYLHINAAGDVEPCAFVHYSNVNIHDVSLLDALQSPIFKAYRNNQPFNGNHMRPCPLLDNPETLRKMVKESGARSTDMQAPENVDDLVSKTLSQSEKWAATADPIWTERERQLTEERVEIA
ncbi:MAG: radical SAM protein [Clostridiales Family XIII bacterium]|jgi:MoaA/NifB/PqqE/SkfB family radical SAM enzyme|nr:radical SAM protein [Clostridiales Family XIII bacterium]